MLGPTPIIFVAAVLSTALNPKTMREHGDFFVTYLYRGHVGR